MSADLVETQEEKSTGLMGVKYVSKPMVFTFKPSTRKFWMKNTFVPLDIVFCFNSAIVEIVHGKPLDPTHIGPSQAVDMVVEFPSGFCKKHDIKKNDFIVLI